MESDACSEVEVERVHFRSDNGSWAVLRVRRLDGGGSFPAAGTFPFEVREGDVLILKGAFAEHPRFGHQFVVEQARSRLPVTSEGIQRYLGSGRIPGVGPKLAERLVRAFGTETLQVLRDHPDRLDGVPGFGEKKRAAVREALADASQRDEALAFLHGLGIGPALAGEIWTRFGPDTFGQVRGRPYQLAETIPGVGFTTADSIAQKIGVAPDDPNRIRAGLVHLLTRALDQGHTCLPAQDLVLRCANLLSLDPDLAGAQLIDAVAGGDLVAVNPASGEWPCVYLPVMEAAEREAARLTRQLLISSGPGTQTNLVFRPDSGSPPLSPEQHSAIECLLHNKVSLLTGGPGVGKTTVLREVVRAFAQGGLRVALASPTGRAARRLSQATGTEAQTLHRLFGIVPGQGGSGRLLDAEVLIVDEVSMLDLPLFVRILARLRPETILVLVGDPDQLPSVGPGSVLADLLNSEAVPKAALTQVFRQAEGSLIAENAQRIRQGEMPVFPPRGQPGDCHFIVKEDPAEGAAMVRRVFQERIPAAFGLDPTHDVQVLSLMHRGLVGTSNLNRLLQEGLARGAEGLAVGERVFQVGDRVMQTRNDYDLDVMNGDTGQVVSLDVPGGSLEAMIDGRRIRFSGRALRDLEPAFAVTVHKAQGGEFPAVILPVYHEHHLMLRRNVLYTAMTRARRILVLIGSPRALAHAVGDARMSRRFGFLGDRLRGTPPVPLGVEALKNSSPWHDPGSSFSLYTAHGDLP